MTTVTGKLIGVADPQRVEMRATLVDVTGKEAVGYVSSVPGELVKPVPINASPDGTWTVTLTANSLITSQAGDTLWAIQEGRAKDGTPIVSYVAVPESGLWWVGDILAGLSSTQTGDSTVVYLASAPGADGASAYEVAVANGFAGSEADWLASLVGPQGNPGPAGATGATGAQGPKGDSGDTGPQPPLGDAGAGDTIALKSTDPTTVNARTPTVHASSHASGGSDPLPPSTIGALSDAGGTISGNLAVTGNALGQATPATHGVASWCYDPALAVNSTSLDNGTLYLTRLDIAASVNVTKIYWWVGNSGSSPVSGQNQVGLYSASGVLLASATVDSDVSSAALKTTTIPSQSLAAGSFCWVAMVFNASVSPTLTRASGWTGVATAANLGLVAATYRFATNGTGRTSLPSSITPASNVGTDFAGPWAAVGA